MSKFNCGDKVRDRVTKIEGIVTGRFEYMTGPVRLQIEYTDQVGRAAEHFVDEDRAELLETVAYRRRAEDQAAELRVTPGVEQPAEVEDVRTHVDQVDEAELGSTESLNEGADETPAS